MHSHDRTLISSLGFSDPDKKEYLHDWACQYLCMKEVGENVCKILNKRYKFFDAKTEHPLSKGEGQYKKVVGFLDVVYTVSRLDTHRGSDGVEKTSEFGFDICLEVKISPFSIGDVIRQVNLYREFIGYLNYSRQFILASTQSVDKYDLKSLEDANIKFLLLGDKFWSWVSSRKGGAA